MKKLLITAVLLALGPFMYFNDGKIISDFNMSSEPHDFAGISTTDRKCTSSAFLFQQCSFKYEVNGEAKSQSYHFLSFGAPDTIHLMRGRKSGVLTSTVGQEYLWNRIFTIFFQVLIGLAMLKSLFNQSKAPQNNQVRAKRVAENPVQRQSKAHRNMNAGIVAPAQAGFGKRAV